MKQKSICLVLAVCLLVPRPAFSGPSGKLLVLDLSCFTVGGFSMVPGLYAHYLFKNIDISGTVQNSLLATQVGHFTCAGLFGVSVIALAAYGDNVKRLDYCTMATILLGTAAAGVGSIASTIAFERLNREPIAHITNNATYSENDHRNAEIVIGTSWGTFIAGILTTIAAFYLAAPQEQVID